MWKFLIPALLMCLGQAQAGTIYKCVSDGKTVYTESPCRKNAYNENVFPVDNELVGTVSPSRRTIEQARERIRMDSTLSGPIVSTGSIPKDDAKCESISKTIAYLDGRARMTLSGWEQDRVREEKRQAQQYYADWNCR